ncbi:MAG: transposase [Pseudomonadota bacterium]|nr:transposase [Pseudomonadota bacterium]
MAATGYARKYAIRLLAHPVPLQALIRRPRARRYGAIVQEALAVCWSAANGICAKRLTPFLPELVPALERHGHLALGPEERTQLLTISAATADRLLRPHRERDQPHGLTTTKPGALLKRQIPVRTFQDWDDARPGCMEIDLVAHCGWSTEGAFLQTLTLTDVATGWTECLPLLYRSQQTVLQALERARQLLPFPLLALDTDNGKEFINTDLLAYCEREAITFTRGRTGKKNDQCFVEQKNGSIVRQLVGYDRFEGDAAYQQLTELYRAVRLYVNFFQPSMKLATKRREGSAVQRTYEPAKTPFRRLVALGVLATETEQRLEALAAALDPVRLLRQLQLLQDALWRHAVFRTPAPAVLPVLDASATQRFTVEPSAAATDPAPALEQALRKYRRSAKPLGPRWWRTRADPFAEVWDEITAWLVVDPVRTATSLFMELQQRHPDRFAEGQCRTLQRRVQEWRAQRTLAFDAEWLEAEPLGSQRLPRPLRVLTTSQAEKPPTPMAASH